MSEQGASVATPPGPASARGPQTRSSGGHGLTWFFIGLFIVLGGGTALFYYREQGQKAPGSAGHESVGEGGASAGLPVEVALPRKGGIERTTTQAGSVHAFEHASLYSKISGYLKLQSVDIGDRVKKDQLLAVIEDPEVDKAVDQNRASLDQSKARVKVAEAKIRSATADKEAADAMVKQSETEVTAKVSNHELQEKQFARIRGLVQRQAVDAKLLDEQQDRLDVSTSELGVTRAAVLTAKALSMAKAAMIESAQADVSEAKANVEIAQANLSKAKVMQDYTRITSPYDGVVTLRSFHRGDFVRAAGEGGGVPVLAVAVTDKMRVVMPVPDTDVPFVDVGDPAKLQIVALPGMIFEGAVSRFSESEDPQSRNMRTEIDLPNADHKLREGMYGRITIHLQPAAPNSVTIPSSGLLGQTGTGEGTVFVVRDHKARKVKVHVGNDNGVEAEILSGLKTDDHVVVRYNGAIEEGTPLAPEAAKVAKSDH